MNKERHSVAFKLPRGGITEVARKTNLTIPIVSDVLAGKKNSPRRAEIYQAAADYLNEYKAKEAAARAALEEALKR